MLNLKLGQNEVVALPTELRSLREAIGSGQHEADNFIRLADGYLKLPRAKDAWETAEAGLRIHPQDAKLKALAVAGLRLLISETYHGSNSAEVGYHLRRLIALAPDDLDARNNLAAKLLSLEQYAEAQELLLGVLAVDVEHRQAWTNLGVALLNQQAYAEALYAFREAQRRDPQNGATAANLAAALVMVNDLDGSLAWGRKAVTLAPNLADAHHNLAVQLRDTGDLTAAMREFKTAVKLNQTRRETVSGLLLTRNYCRLDPKLLLQYAPLVEGAYGAGSQRITTRKAKVVGQKLRVGYVSADLRRHSVAYFIDAILAHHDREHCEVFLYYPRSTGDEVTARLRAYGGHWRPLVGLNDRQAADLVYDDGIDVLVDLSGHTEGNRLGVFAQHRAPVQMSYLGYPGSTLLRAMDWRITDGWADPEGNEAYGTERLLRVPTGFLCYSTLGEPYPAVNRNGSSARTYLCCNGLAKINDEVLKVWAQLLERDPGSQLAIKTRGLDQPGVSDAFRQRCWAAGIDSKRLRLEGHTPERHFHLDTYNTADVALDTFPYCGTTTTCEALYMGLPVITLAGVTHGQRVGASLVHTSGMGQIALDHETYIQQALAARRDPRQRERLEASPLMDGARLARSLEELYSRAAALR